MTGEMYESEVTRENFPFHFAAADAVDGASVHPFDKYQGPYIHVPKKGRFFLATDDGAVCEWYSEQNDAISESFLATADWCIADSTAAFRDLIVNGGNAIVR